MQLTRIPNGNFMLSMVSYQVCIYKVCMYKAAVVQWCSKWIGDPRHLSSNPVCKHGVSFQKTNLYGYVIGFILLFSTFSRITYYAHNNIT